MEIVASLLRSDPVARAKSESLLRIVVPLLLATSLLSPISAQAHGPLFGWGPRTIWANGYAIGVELESNVTARRAAQELGYHFGYGITEDWQASVKLHQETHDLFSVSSFGNATVRSRYRFYFNPVEGGLYHATAIGGAELPTGASEHARDGTDVFGGLAAGYEGRRWLFFGAARYRRRGSAEEGVDRGNVFRYDLSAGIRPVKTGYEQPDLVLMAELNGQVFGASERPGGHGGENHHGAAGAGGHRLLAGFGAWLTYQNFALKPGIQIPVASTLEGERFDYHALLEAEVHF